MRMMEQVNITEQYGDGFISPQFSVQQSACLSAGHLTVRELISI